VYRELDSRCSDGISVALYWHTQSGELLLEVEDYRSGDSVSRVVPECEATFAYSHPYAWLGSQVVATA